jgi:type II secretory pathway pseudopilin PulG
VATSSDNSVAYLALILVTLSVTAYGQTNVLADPTLLNWGFVLGQLLQAILVLVLPSIAVVIVALAAKALKWVGVQMTQQQRDRLQDIVVNGINLAGDQLKGQLGKIPPVEIKNKLLAIVLSYVQDHGLPAVKALGMAFDSPEFPGAIAARVERALNDPLAPTPPWLTPPEVLAMGRTRQAPSIGTDGVEQRPVDVGGNAADIPVSDTAHPFNHVRY